MRVTGGAHAGPRRGAAEARAAHRRCTSGAQASTAYDEDTHARRILLSVYLAIAHSVVTANLGIAVVHSIVIAAVLAR